MRLEHDPVVVRTGGDPTEFDPLQRKDHALRNIITLASFHEPDDDVQQTLAAIRSIARRALFSKTA